MTMPALKAQPLVATQADPADFPMDLSSYPKVHDVEGKLLDGTPFQVVYYGKKCLTEVPTKEDWQHLADGFKKSGRKIVGLLCPPAYVPMTHYDKDEDSPTVQEFLDGNYENKGRTVAIALFYPAVEVTDGNVDKG